MVTDERDAQPERDGERTKTDDGLFLPLRFEAIPGPIGRQISQEREVRLLEQTAGPAFTVD